MVCRGRPGELAASSKSAKWNIFDTPIYRELSKMCASTILKYHNQL